MLNSKHFQYTEFTCHSGAPYPPEWIDERLQSLCDTLDAIRDAWGGPITVVCGYRTPEYNKQLRARSSGVAANSQHPQGRAADVGPVPRTPEMVRRLAATINTMIARGELPLLGGMGEYVGWVHVDVRPKSPPDHVARWTGSGFGSEPV